MIPVPLVPPTVLSTHQDPLSHAAKAFHDALPPKDFLALKTQLQHYCQRLDGKPLRVGTMFSGCDVAVKALDAIQEHWSEVGMELQFHHLFACEIEEWKQEFILHHLNPQFMFEDAVELARNDWVGQDTISEKHVKVPDIDLLFAGFECDSVSALNASRNKSSNCVAEGTGKTGITARATLDFIIAKKPKWTILENAKTLGKDNVLAIQKCLNQKEFVAQPVMLDSARYGAVARRVRQYIVVEHVPGRSNEECQRGTSTMQAVAQSLQMLEIGPGDLDAFLLDTHDPRRSTWLTQERAESEGNSNRGVKRAMAKGEGTEKYKVEHLDCFRRQNLAWPPDWKNDPELAKACDYLPIRMREVAYYESHRPRDREEREAETAHDLNVSIQFGCNAKD